MHIQQAAQALQKAVSRRSVFDSWKPEMKHDDNVVEFVPRDPPVDYRPCIEFVPSEYWFIWDKLDKLTKEWCSAMMTDRCWSDRSFKMVVNAIVGHTSCSKGDAEGLAYYLKGEAYWFTAGERAAIRRDWREALLVDRRIEVKTGRVMQYTSARV